MASVGQGQGQGGQGGQGRAMQTFVDAPRDTELAIQISGLHEKKTRKTYQGLRTNYLALLRVQHGNYVWIGPI
jgi:hypothetical protein